MKYTILCELNGRRINVQSDDAIAASAVACALSEKWGTRVELWSGLRRLEVYEDGRAMGGDLK
jgi:hypothetical protein